MSKKPTAFQELKKKVSKIEKDVVTMQKDIAEIKRVLKDAHIMSLDT